MESVAVVAVPFPAQGHLNQLLHLSLHLASRGLPVHYAARPPGAVARARLGPPGPGLRPLPRPRPAGVRAAAAGPNRPDVLPVPPDAHAGRPRGPRGGPAGQAPRQSLRPPPPRGRGLRPPELLRGRRGGEAFCVQCVSVSYNVAFKDAGHRLLRGHGLEFHPVDACVSKEFEEYIARTWQDGQQGATVRGLLVNTCRALEGEFIDAEAQSPEYGGQRIFAIGPLNPLLLDARTTTTTPGLPRHECLAWLDRQPPASVLYVSFGTTSSLLAEQVAEIGAALRDSKRRFIWVLRDADRAAHDEEATESRHAKALPSLPGFERQTEGTGLVVTGWAPQLEILAHGATAAFMSHCGWNSTVESLSHGKPILAWPMHSDQPWDAELLCKYLKAGLLVRPLEKRNTVVPAEAIREVIERAMVSEEGLQTRERAKALGESIRASVAEGGSAHKDMEEFITYIAR